jgi:hypothetical protein
MAYQAEVRVTEVEQGVLKMQADHMKLSCSDELNEEYGLAGTSTERKNQIADICAEAHNTYVTLKRIRDNYRAYRNAGASYIALEQ